MLNYGTFDELHLIIMKLNISRGVNLTLRMLQDVFQLDKGLGWVEPTQLAFIILGASMAALALMILVVAILATGATRHEVYQTSGGRAGGRIGKYIKSKPI